jgi:hypothetical protein
MDVWKEYSLRGEKRHNDKDKASIKKKVEVAPEE